MPREQNDTSTNTEGRSEEELEYERTHPDWLADVPAAPPEVTASQYEHTKPEEAGHLLPEDERGRS